MSASARERRHLGRQDREGVVVARTDGDRITDAKGKRYIDFLMGWCVGNFGWRPPSATRLRRFRGPDYVYPGFSYAGWAELAALLSGMAPGRLTKCFRATGGSEAVDLALQAAMVHTRRGKFLAIEDAYHGNSIGTLSIGSADSRKRIANLLPGCAWIRPPLDDRALNRVETRLRKRDVAAVVMEPVIINLGVLVPEPEFMHGLQRLCRRYGTLLIMDEVATGFGRTGALFASEHFGLEPDMLCVAKAVTGGSAGLGALLATDEVASSMEERGSFYSTYGWHPLATDAAIATLRWLARNEKRLMKRVADTSAYFRARLEEMPFDESTALNIKGLAIGIDIGDEDRASAIQRRCRRRGLLISVEGTSLLLLPALTVDRRTAEEGLDVLERCVRT